LAGEEVEFGQLILRKIITNVATRYQIYRLKTSKLTLAGPQTHWGSLQRSPDPLAGFKGPSSEGKGGTLNG